MRVKTYLERCTGCQVCTLACSMTQIGSFNPRAAKIVVPVAVTGQAIAIEFPQRCGTSLVDQCSFGAVPPCVEICPTGALELLGVGEAAEVR